MKKNIRLTAFVLLLAFFLQTNVKAQSNEGFGDVKGTNLLNAGVGLGSFGLSGTGGLPLIASFEHGFAKSISAGLEAGFIQQSYGSDWKYTYLIVGPRGSYHFALTNPKLDLYGGAGLLYRHFSFRSSAVVSGGDEPTYDFNSSGGDMIIDLHAGGRYLFNNRVGAFGELSYGISPLKLGVTLKF